MTHPADDAPPFTLRQAAEIDALLDEIERLQEDNDRRRVAALVLDRVVAELRAKKAA